jgi:hypothetical protein
MPGFLLRHCEEAQPTKQSSSFQRRWIASPGAKFAVANFVAGSQ